MSSAQDQQHTFPALPPSLSAGDHEMRDYYTAQDAPRPATNQAPYLTPYLGLRARLSQIWINRWTTLLLLVLIRTLIAVANLDDSLDSARRQALSACNSVESIGSAMASMPHYMSQGTNQLTATGVEKAVNGLLSLLELTVTGVEEIVVFVINLLTSTYVCLITLAVSGSLNVAVDVASDITDFLNKNLGEIGDDIQQGINGFQDQVNGLVEGLNSIPQLFGSDGGLPTLDIDRDIDRLSNLQLPASVQDGLDKLNRSIPTFAEVNEATKSIIRLPFEEIKEKIRETLVAYEFDRSAFPVPQKEQLSFCSDNEGINGFFDRLEDIAGIARRAFIGVVVTLAVLVCVPMAYREIRRWRVMQQRAQLVSRHAFDPLDVVYISSRPFSSSVGIKLANRFSSTRHQTLIRWAVAYASSTSALFVLSLGAAGLLACLCQFILLSSIKKEVPALANQVGAFADKVVFALNNASAQWAVQTNGVIRATSEELNEEIFGWATQSSTALNETLNTFVDGMMDALNVTFGDTVLYDPIKEVLNCLILLKVQGIQKGLTWVSENARVDFPLMPNDTFSLGALASIGDDSKAGSFLASPGTVAGDEITDAVVRMTQKIESGIREEAIISTCVILLWLIIAMIGFARSGILCFATGKTRAEGGQTFASDPATDNLRGHDYGSAPPYTLTPRPFPSATLGDDAPPSPNEKVGNVGARQVLNFTRPSHARVSSHGQVALTTPVHPNEKTYMNSIATGAR